MKKKYQQTNHNRNCEVFEIRNYEVVYKHSLAVGPTPLNFCGDPLTEDDP